ncbi:MAG: VOC family protein [Dehalococcoidia bacterium]
MRSQGVDHVHIVVEDLDRASEFFTQLFESQGAAIKEVPEFGFRFQFIQVGSTVIELLEATSPDSPIGQFLKNRGEGVHALSFKVDDLDAAVAELQRRGLRLVSRATVGRIREAHFHPKDTHGFMIELVEHPGTIGATIDFMER